jgi:glyoxylase-like metal-dependent hydrolase (beta-lactamase superfamily II)
MDAPVDPALTSVPASVVAAFRPDAPPRELPLGADQYEVAPGIVHVHGAYDVAIVAQEDGLVIVEAPISSKYSAMVLAEAARRYPGKPVKAVVTTSDAWPHVAGLREYAARGVPIYALDLNEAIVRRTLAASHKQKPDALQEHPRQPVLRIVRAKTVIGAGRNRIELYPLRGEGSERQLMAYFPDHKLLYGSDAFGPGSDAGYFHPQTVSEVVQAVLREHLAVERFFMMHLKAAAYGELLAIPESKG